jgi:predicted  nucleic acid-binding Zn-ribbon protein
MHKCINCGRTYSEQDESILKGCKCGSNLFIIQKSEQEQKESIIKEIDRFLNSLKRKKHIEAKIHFDLENIKVIKEGIYELNIRKLFEKSPIVVEIKDGAYHVHLPSAFEKGKYEGFVLREIEKEFLDEEKKLKKEIEE